MKIDCVRFFVQDVDVLTDWFMRVLDFQLVSEHQDYPWIVPTSETNCLPEKTNILKRGSVTFLVSSSPSFAGQVGKYLKHHPPGVGEICFLVENLDIAIARIQNLTGKKVETLHQSNRDGNLIRWAHIPTEITLNHHHILVERSFCPSKCQTSHPAYSLEIDHIVINVPQGQLTSTASWYEKVLDLQPQQSFKIQTAKSGLCSQVMESKCGSVQIPINEPTTANSQIQEFINANNGAGVQHIALRFPNLITSIAQFRQRGLSFLPVPASYYTNLTLRPGFSFSQTELQAIAQQKILVDWHEDTPLSLLLQIFTQPIFNQPTFFFEFIERRQQAKGFGEGNFRALFTAMELEQAKRGTLD